MNDSKAKQNKPTENKMGVMPVNKLLLSMAIPMMISMLVQALYNIVDSIFVSYINQDALTAVGLAFPLQNLMMAVAIGTGVGINALLSKSLGEKNQKMVNQTAGNGIFIELLSAFVCMILSTFFIRIFFSVQTDIPVIIEYGCNYLFICMFFCIPVFGQVTFERLLLSTGKTIFSMTTQAFGAIINIILDPILIFGLGPAPELGIRGAAIATVTAQFCAMLLAIFFNLKVNKEIHFNELKGFRPNGGIIKRIYAVALPSIIMMSIGSAMTFGLNKILLKFTDTAVAAFSIYFKLQSFIFMPVFGLNNGMVPIIAYNYGARKPDRMIKTIKLSITYAVCIMIIGFTVMQIFPGAFLRLFNATDELMEIGIPMLRIIAIHFLLAGFCVICGSVFQALEKGVFSMFISLCRQLVVLLPAAYLLSLTGSLNAVWFAFPIAEGASLLLTALCMIRVYNEKIKPLQVSAEKQATA
jgi:putative MATE family efflux protein